MGYDIHIEHMSVTIPTSKLQSAVEALRAFWKKASFSLPSKEATGDYQELKLLLNLGGDAWFAVSDDTAHVAIGSETTYELRNTDDWLGRFKAIAPFIDADSAIGFRGEDDSRWQWVFSGGQLLVEDAVTLYGAASHAPECVAKIVKLIHPENDSHAFEDDRLHQIAEILRTHGFGPYAGKGIAEAIATAADDKS